MWKLEGKTEKRNVMNVAGKPLKEGEQGEEEGKGWGGIGK